MRMCKRCGQMKKEFHSKYLCIDCRKKYKKEKYELTKDDSNKKSRDRYKRLRDENPEEYRERRDKQNEEKRLKRYIKRELAPEKSEEQKLVEKEQKRLKKLEYAKEYRKNNKEKVKASNKKWREENKEERKIKKKEYYESTKEKNSHERYLRNKEYLERNPQAKFNIQFRGRILAGFRRFSKNGKTETCKEYGIDFEAIYKKVGPKPGKLYHLDHIIPISLFQFDNKEHVRLAHCPENLRWILGKENLEKANKIIPELIKGNPILEDICNILDIKIP